MDLQSLIMQANNNNGSGLLAVEARLGLCAEIGAALTSPAYFVVLHMHLGLLATTMLAIGVLVHQFWRHKIKMHGNLLILLANIVLINFLQTLAQFAWLLRYRIILFASSDPCQLLTPLWMVCLFFGPGYVQSVACPALHFCVMAERVRATFLAEKYESERQRLGIGMVAAIWTLSLAYATFVLLTMFLDPAVPREEGIVYAASKYSALSILYLNIGLLGLIILTAGCDWRLTLLNRRLRMARLSQKNYSLSRNYQLQENALAMRLILPIDISYAVLFTLFNSLVVFIRAQRSSLPLADYRFYYNLINTLLFVYTAVTTLVYIRFVHFVSRCQKRAVNATPVVDQGNVYMRQLHSQWKLTNHQASAAGHSPISTQAQGQHLGGVGIAGVGGGGGGGGHVADVVMAATVSRSNQP